MKQYTQALVGIGTEALQHWYKGENLWYYKKPWAVWQFAFKTEMLRKNKLQFQPHVKNNEDAMFVVECSIYAQSVVCISDYLYNYDFRKDGALFSRVNSKDKIFYDKYVLIAERERLRKLVKQVDLVDNYCGSQVFSCIQLCVSLSSSGYAGYRQCKKYICDKHVQDSIRRVPIKGAPLKFRIPVLLLKCHMQWLLFALIYLLSKFGMADKLKA